jgi:hypothetical protein
MLRDVERTIDEKLEIAIAKLAAANPVKEEIQMS